jgi:hypothetical protein
MEPEDQWCEQRMWRSMGIDTKAEIICAVTGIAFIIAPFFDMPNNFTDEHAMFHVAFVFLGLGTIFYHVFPNFESNNQATIYELDWYPMVFTCASLVLIYIWPLRRCLNLVGVYLMCVAFMSWFSFLILSVYHVSVDIRNGVMVGVPVLVFAGFSVAVLGQRSFYTWGLLLVGLTIWLVNKYLCSYYYWLAIFHGIYHVLMAFALWSAGCLGLELASDFKNV